MPGDRITQLQKEQLVRLHNLGYSAANAAAMVRPPMSTTSAKRILTGALRADQEIRAAGELPDPKTWAQLSADAKTGLQDFNAFSEMFLCRRPSAWRRDAAMRVVETVVDKTDRDYTVANVFPGAGKSTLFTLDIPVWIVAGGGTMDPEFGRALRILLGSYTMNLATHYVARARRILELLRPYWDKDQRREATHSIVGEYGRFKPIAGQGEEKLWTREQFLVAQIGNRDIVEKEPTFMAASRESGFLGDRYDFCSWDDLITTKNARKFRDPVFMAEFSEWFTDEAETRVEPGGSLWLVGQRLGRNDLYRNRLDETYVDEDGSTRTRYKHIVYPAHHDELCDAADGGSHRQWDGDASGCLTDEWRLPYREIVKLMQRPNYRTVYQQEDADPDTVLVHDAWLDGGMDPFGYDAPGSMDYDRGFWQHPKDSPRMLDYCVVDPSGRSGYWAIEWWSIQDTPNVPVNERFRYLIWGERRKMMAGLERGFLDYDPETREHVGLMEEVQKASIAGGHPIRVWVIEQNSAHVYLGQTFSFQLWKKRFPYVTVIPHETQKNKADPERGVEASLPMAYRSGHKRLPAAPGKDSLNYLKIKRAELTGWPNAATSDTVMADWFGEYNLERIVRAARRSQPHKTQELKLPPYLMAQRREVSTRPGG